MQKRSQQWLQLVAFVGAVVIFFYAYKQHAWGMTHGGHGLSTFDWLVAGVGAALMMLTAICYTPRTP